MSKIGRKPITITKDVKIIIKPGAVEVEGPKGKLSLSFSSRIKLELKDNQVFVTRAANTRTDRCLHGLYRSLLVNMLIGVTQGYVKELEIIGVGFKAQVQGNSLNMNLGFSHPVNFAIPSNIKIEAPKNTHIIIKGIDKEKVGQVAAEIRAIYPPEPYKGKGIRYMGEYVKKKVGKSQAAAK